MTLYRETTCEHGAVGTHELWTQDTGQGKGCHGGSREEVTIDYEAALKHLELDAGENLPIGWAKVVVNAALGE